jgi:hypothetical protein
MAPLTWLSSVGGYLKRILLVVISKLCSPSLAEKLQIHDPDISSLPPEVLSEVLQFSKWGDCLQWAIAPVSRRHACITICRINSTVEQVSLLPQSFSNLTIVI